MPKLNSTSLFTLLLLFILSTSFSLAEKENPNPKKFFALNAITPYHLAQDNDPDIWKKTIQNLAAAKELGATHVRIDMWWHSIEPEEGNFQWELPDRVMAEITKAGLIPYPILCYNSAWSPNKSPATDSERKKYGRYVYNLVKRYGHIAPVMEVWNEPNIKMFWQPEPNATDYVALLREADEQAHAANPDVKLIGFALAGADLDFIRESYRQGAARYTDGVAFHHYQANENESVLEKEIFEILELMRMYGDGDEPLLITESGLSTGTSPVIKTSTEFEQARGLVRKHLTALAQGVDQFYYFKLLDDVVESDPDGYWGLLKWDMEEKPSAQSYRTMTKHLRNTEYLGRLRGYEVDSEQFGESQLMAFREKSGEILVVGWARYESKDGVVDVQLPSVSGLEVTDYLGNTSSEDKRNEQKIARITLTENPVYIRGLSHEIIDGVSLKFNPRILFLAPGERRSIEVEFTNYHPTQITVSLSEFEEELLKYGVLAIASQSEIRAEPSETVRQEIVVALREEANPFIRRTFPVLGKFGAYGALDIVRSDALSIELLFLDKQSDILSLKSTVQNLRPYPLSGRVDSNLNQQSIPFEMLRPTEKVEAIFHQHLKSGEQRFVAEAKTNRGGRSKSSYAIYVTAAPPEELEVDGSLEEWIDLPSINLSPNTEMLMTLSNEVQTIDPNDFSATLKVAFTQTHLAFALEVMDDNPLINSFKTSEIWRGDSLQLYIGVDGPTTNLIYQPSDFQIGFSASTNDRTSQTWNWRSLSESEDGGAPINGAELFVKETDSGYIMESKVPLSEFGIETLTSGQTLGFDVQLNDLDNPEGEMFDSAIMWNGDSDNWRDPSLWGLLVVGPINNDN